MREPRNIDELNYLTRIPKELRDESGRVFHIRSWDVETIENMHTIPVITLEVLAELPPMRSGGKE